MNPLQQALDLMNKHFQRPSTRIELLTYKEVSCKQHTKHF